MPTMRHVVRTSTGSPSSTSPIGGRAAAGWAVVVATAALAAQPCASGQQPTTAAPDSAAKAAAIAAPGGLRIEQRSRGADEGSPGGGGYRAAVGPEGSRLPVVVVGGTPYQMGWHVGRLLAPEIGRFVPELLERVVAGTGISREALAAAWSTTAAYTDDRFEQELLGIAAGSGVPLDALQAAHALPLLMPYSCSSVAAWGSATADGHLYQTRNLDWELELGAHRFPAVVLYLPAAGRPHLLPTFAGCAGANCGLSAAGIALSEMGYASADDMPYDLHAPHFTTWFRTLLYDADSLTAALEIFGRQPLTKRYQFVFGDGRADRRAVKIRADATPAGDEVRVWAADDPDDPLAPAVLPDLVYQDEGRGAFPYLQRHHGSLDAARLVEVACAIPIKGGNVLDVVFDATALRAWISYAGADGEAYQRPFVPVDVAALDGDGDGRPDVEEGCGAGADGTPDFLDAAAR